MNRNTNQKKNQASSRSKSKRKSQSKSKGNKTVERVFTHAHESMTYNNNEWTNNHDYEIFSNIQTN